MSAPLDRTQRLVAMFDSFAKTALRNLSRNLKRDKANKENREGVIDAPMQYIIDTLSHEDTYGVEHILYADKFTCVVHNQTLYEALLNLPDQQRAVLLLDFWQGWTDIEIANELEVTTRTVYNFRQRAFKAIQRFYEQKRQEP